LEYFGNFGRFYRRFVALPAPPIILTKARLIEGREDRHEHKDAGEAARIIGRRNVPSALIQDSPTVARVVRMSEAVF
jgi:hypothetical protein